MQLVRHTATPHIGNLIKSSQRIQPRFTTRLKFSTDAAEETPVAVIENLVAAQQGFVSRALRTSAKAKYKNLPIGQQKLQYLCRMVRGLNIREALIQLRLCSKRKSYFLRRGLRTLANSAVNTLNMQRDRLYISSLAVTRGVQHKRIDFRARGRTGFQTMSKSNLYITVAEQPHHPGEIRIGRFGRTIDTWKSFDRLSDAWKLKRAEERGL